MNIFPKKPKASQRRRSADGTTPGRARTGQRRAMSTMSQAQRLLGNHAMQSAPESGGREGSRPATSIPVKTALRPHDNSPTTLQREAQIYAHDKTPLRIGNEVIAWDAKPLGAQETGAHLREIREQFGAEGVTQSVRGLAATRGEGFANSAAKHSGVFLEGGSRDGGAIGRDAAGAIQASASSTRLPEDARRKLTDASGHDFSGVSIHNDANAHRAADQLNARAFTVGNDIYFGKNEYQPETAAGMDLLAHEAAHTVQQRGATPAAPGAHAHTSRSEDNPDEEQASHFGAAVAGSRSSTPPRLAPSKKSGEIDRAISFTRANDTFTRNAVVPDENAAGFRLRSNPVPTFQWDTEVTIHGVAGDPFGNFEVGFMQVERAFWINVFWGTGANRTHRNVRADALPRRDATAEANTWYDDGGPSVAAAFAANGDVRTPSFDDTPSTGRQPWANPNGSGTTNGFFNYGDAFVTYLSARDTTVGTGANAFRHIACIYWNFMIDGRFDSTQAVGSRITVTTPGAVNRGGIIRGGSAEFPSMHGGTIANGHDISTDT